MKGRLSFMLRKELLQTLRDPRMRMVILVVPIFQTLVFGYAVTTDVRNVETAVVDLAGDERSRGITADFTASGIFRETSFHSYSDAWSAMDQGHVSAMLFFDPGGAVQFVVDGSRGISGGVTAGYASAILAGGGETPVRVESRAWYNPLLESRNFYVPGVIAMMVMVITLILSSMAVVREKEMGTMEQIMVTPIRRWEFILGKTLPFAGIGMINVLLVSAVAILWFHIPMAGSIWLVLLSAILFLMNTLGAGLLISTVSSTQQQAMLSCFLFIFPATLLSGFAFPVANMPWPVRQLTLLNPVRYEMEILRNLFLKGSGFQELWPQYTALLILGMLLLAAATLRFRKTSA